MQIYHFWLDFMSILSFCPFVLFSDFSEPFSRKSRSNLEPFSVVLHRYRSLFLFSTHVPKPCSFFARSSLGPFVLFVCFSLVSVGMSSPLAFPFRSQKSIGFSRSRYDPVLNGTFSIKCMCPLTYIHTKSADLVLFIYSPRPSHCLTIQIYNRKPTPI